VTGGKEEGWARPPSVLPEEGTVLCRNKETENVHRTTEPSCAFGTVAFTYGKAGDSGHFAFLRHKAHETPSAATLTCTYQKRSRRRKRIKKKEEETKENKQEEDEKEKEEQQQKKEEIENDEIKYRRRRRITEHGSTAVPL
jgi:hypothetical protein